MNVKEISTIMDGYNEKTVTKKQPFAVHKRLNPMHPAPDVTKAELRAEWGDPKDIKELSEKELEKIRQKISRKRKPPIFTSLTLPPKIVRDAWYGVENEKKPTTKKRNINPLYPPSDMTKEEQKELENEWGDPKKSKI